MRDSDQYMFVKFRIKLERGGNIKIELLQNLKNLYELENHQGISMYSMKDIGLFKLLSASDRASKKDIYDLDFITETIPLIELYKALIIKNEKYNNEEDKTVFDLNHHEQLIGNPRLLLKFDERDLRYSDTKREFLKHTRDTIEIVNGNKTWIQAKYSWRSKVRHLFTLLDMPFPRPKIRY